MLTIRCTAVTVLILAAVALTMASDTDLQKVLKEGNDQFTAKMFTEVLKENPDKSFVLSAFSVLPPLAELAIASEGESREELFKAIGFSNENVTKAIFTDLSKELSLVKGIELKMANKVFVAQGFELNDNFAEMSKDVFNSEVQNVDFGDNESAAKTINTWVEDHTNKRIQKLVDPNTLDSSTMSVLVNAIYFKGSWKNKFQTAATSDRPFYVSKDTTLQVPTMQRVGDYLYGESQELDAKIIQLPYEGDESSLWIVLPNKVDGIHDLAEKLKDPAALTRAENDTYKTRVDLYLPKFKIETTTDLKEILQNMKVIKLFTGEANLNNLLKNTSGLSVSSATQKAFIEVNEEGAEAAAANAFSINRSLRVIRTVPFVVDHPFYYVLKYKHLILFNGEYYH